MLNVFQDTILGSVKVIGTGQISAKMKDESWEIPKLQVLLYINENEEEDIYTAYCIDLQMHYSHRLLNRAIEEMHKSVISDLESISKNERRIEILQEVLQDAPMELYSLYIVHNALFVNKQHSVTEQHNTKKMNQGTFLKPISLPAFSKKSTMPLIPTSVESQVDLYQDACLV